MVLFRFEARLPKMVAEKLIFKVKKHYKEGVQEEMFLNFEQIEFINTDCSGIRAPAREKMFFIVLVLCFSIIAYNNTLVKIVTSPIL